MDDLASIAAELYAGPREEFTEARNARATAARKAGDKELAQRIKALRKPTSAAWLLNRLIAANPAESDELDELGEALRQAHRQLARDELRELSHQRRALINSLLGKARELAKAEGVPMSESVTREIEGTLEAAIADENAAAELTSGTLSSALTPGGSEQWLTAASSPAPAGLSLVKPLPEEKRTPSRPVKREKPAPPRQEDAERRKREARAEAEERVERTEAEKAEAEEELRGLEAKVAELNAEAEKLEAELTEVRRRHWEARKAQAAVRKAAQRAENAAEAARRALAGLSD